MKLLLASNSPRRRELLHLLDIDYEIVTPREIDEVYPADLKPENVAPYLSALKADAYLDLPGENEILVTADTVVICGGRILGKPHSEDEAIAMLKSLSDRSHTVVTGVTLVSACRRITFAEHTVVTFDALSDNDIKSYVRKYKPFDKAGAYGIQEWIGAIGIKGIDGCFYNVMGLPVHALWRNLQNLL